MPKRILVIEEEDGSFIEAELDECRIVEVPDDFEGLGEPLADDDDEGLPAELDDFESVSLVEALMEEYRPVTGGVSPLAPSQVITPRIDLPPTERDADEWPMQVKSNPENRR